LFADVTAENEKGRLPEEELYALYYLPNLIREIKGRIMRWAGRALRIEGGGGEEWCIQSFCWET
jgi:hypothetical protein